MLFNSYAFLFLFLPATLAGLYALAWSGRTGLAVWWAGLASLVFYSVWDVRFLPVLLVSMMFNYALGNMLLRWPSRALAAFGVAANLAALGYFKYTGFLLTTLNRAAGAHFSIPDIVMPIGISFFTFTQIAYLVDAYKRKAHHYTIAQYLLFVSFFPHLVAGPILRHHSVLPQIESGKFGRPSARTAYIGLIFFACGMFKKVMIADSFAPYVTQLYDAPGLLSTGEAWSAALLYTLQLYFDFSGYSDMAFGLALLLNVRIPLNFNSPYKAVSMIEFWRRWHISLSLFLRDYLYIPLGGSRKGPPRHITNLLVTMLLGGLWHGAGWTFVLWGAWHGALLAVNHLWRKAALTIPRALAWGMTFLCVMLGWVFFRAPSLASGWNILSAMLGAGGAAGALKDAQMAYALMGAGLLWCVFAPNTRWLALRHKPARWIPLLAAILLFVCVCNLSKPSEFLYFQF